MLLSFIIIFIVQITSDQSFLLTKYSRNLSDYTNCKLQQQYVIGMSTYISQDDSLYLVSLFLHVSR